MYVDGEDPAEEGKLKMPKIGPQRGWAWVHFVHEGGADLRHEDGRQARGDKPGEPVSKLGAHSPISAALCPASARASVHHPHTHPLHFIPRGPGLKRTHFKEST